MREIIHAEDAPAASYNESMTSSIPKKPRAKRPSGGAAPTPKPAPASQLRAQTRRVMSKHYRAKYGVR